MLRSRLIPCLLIHNGALVKTANFKNHIYVGDPLNAVRIFNEKMVDELIVLDIDATVKNLEPNFEVIGKLAAQCRMPFCYGGGVKTVEQIRTIIGLGVEKVSLSSAAIKDFSIVTEASKLVGSQSLVFTLDIIKSDSFECGYSVVTHNGTRHVKIDPLELLKQAQDAGVGEILINNVDRDGIGIGYDHELLDLIEPRVRVPLVFLGGAGAYQDIVTLGERPRKLGIAAGSLFVFKGKYRAVLIQYPEWKTKIEILGG